MRPGPAGARPARRQGACWRLLPPPGPLGAEAGRVTVVAHVNRSTGCAMNDRESPGRDPPDGHGRSWAHRPPRRPAVAGQIGSARIEGGELPERPRREVADIVD